MGDAGEGIPHSPSMEALLGRMVIAPTATSSRFRTGEILAPQLSEPTHRKWPVRLAWRAASRTLLVRTGKGEDALKSSSCLTLVTCQSSLTIYPIQHRSADPCLSGKVGCRQFRTLGFSGSKRSSQALTPGLPSRSVRCFMLSLSRACLLLLGFRLGAVPSADNLLPRELSPDNCYMCPPVSPPLLIIEVDMYSYVSLARLGAFLGPGSFLGPPDT